MLLVIDIGNTNIKIGIFDGEKLLDSIRLATTTNKTSDEYGLSVVDLLSSKGIKTTDIDGVIMSSVNPNFNYTFEHLCIHYFKIKPMVVSAMLDCGLDIKYDNPKELGADRIVNSYSAFKQYGAPCIVVDFGTATTFNVISSKKELLGGAIFPGLKTSTDSLSENAARLPKIEINIPDKVIGKSTITGMQSGIIYGFVGMVEYLVAKIKDEANIPNAVVVATGGLSELICRGTNVIDVVDRTLTLKGLRLLYDLNKA